jgi:hypothetical protein
MECLQCKAPNSDDSRYCGKCGAELSTTLNETVWRRGIRDRQAIEIEITEAVFERLVKWSKWLVALGALIFGGILGWSYHDVRSAVGSGKTQIENAVNEGRNEISQAKQSISGLKPEIDQLQSDADKYKKVNEQIANLQKQLKDVKGDVLDLRNKKLIVKSVETAPGTTGGGLLSFGPKIGCPALPKGIKVAICAQDSPPSIYQVVETGYIRPVGGLSSMGFQDTSIGKKPDCTLAVRGTLYVEKGTGSAADKPFLCVRRSNGTYDWTQLSTTQ